MRISKKTLTRILLVLLILQFPVILFLSNARYMTFNLDFYEKEFNKYAPDVESPLEITSDLLDYLKYPKTDTTYLNKFTEQEIQHLIEVKALMHNFIILLNSCFVFLISFVLLLYYVDSKKLLKNFSLAAIYGGILTSASLLILYISIKDFESAFTKFHHVFFRIGNWQFPNDFLLVRLFPAQFFMDIVNKIMSNIFISANILILVGVVLFIIYKKKVR